jgi:hypothetical protein
MNFKSLTKELHTIKKLCKKHDIALSRRFLEIKVEGFNLLGLNLKFSNFYTYKDLCGELTPDEPIYCLKFNRGYFILGTLHGGKLMVSKKTNTKYITKNSIRFISNDLLHEPYYAGNSYYIKINKNEYESICKFLTLKLKITRESS